MKNGLRLILATALCAVAAPLAGDAQTTPAAQAAPVTLAPGDAVRGKANFMAYGCYECHGTVAQGNYSGIPKLAPHPLPLGAILAYIRRPTGEMPSYATVILPDKDVADIYAYLASIPTGKPASAIPALSSVSTTPK